MPQLSSWTHKTGYQPWAHLWLLLKSRSHYHHSSNICRHLRTLSKKEEKKGRCAISINSENHPCSIFAQYLVWKLCQVWDPARTWMKCSIKSEPAHKGDNQCMKEVTHPQERPELPMVTVTRHVSKYKVRNSTRSKSSVNQFSLSSTFI